MSKAQQPRFVLASTSASRRLLLSNAGLEFESEAPGVDEAAVKLAMASASPKQLAKKLAAEKSLAVSSRRPEAFVLGADQTLELQGQSFDKPSSLQQARLQLQQLRGSLHQLHSALCIARNGEVVWHECVTASLKMRNFSDQELDAYLSRAGEKPLHSVGAYQVEGPAIHLFENIEGDYFTILGLPLLQLLTALRQFGIGLA